MGKRVIVVDDSREVGRLILAALQSLQADLTVQVFISAEEALLEASRSAVDVLVSDLRLPGKSGIELVKEMRQRHPNLRAIFVTGMTDQAMLHQAKKIEVDGFFQKPINMTAFLETVRASLAKAGEAKADTGPLTAKPTAPERPRRGTGVLRLAGGEGPAARVRRGPAPTRLSEAITTLRQRLGAQAVFILDDHGRVVELAGELPAGDFEQDWAPRVMGAVSAAQKAARLVGEAPAPLVIALQGSDYHMALAPVDHYALILLLKPGRASLRLGLAVEEALLAQTILKELLGQMGVRAAPLPLTSPPESEPAAAIEPPALAPVAPVAFTHPVPAPVVEAEAPLIEEPALDEFMDKISSSAQDVSREKANAFWDDLTNGNAVTPHPPDSITYDQARQLGLAPGEDQD